mgnify:CR=1 FL=1
MNCHIYQTGDIVVSGHNILPTGFETHRNSFLTSSAWRLFQLSMQAQDWNSSRGTLVIMTFKVPASHIHMAQSMGQVHTSAIDNPAFAGTMISLVLLLSEGMTGASVSIKAC